MGTALCPRSCRFGLVLGCRTSAVSLRSRCRCTVGYSHSFVPRDPWTSGDVAYSSAEGIALAAALRLASLRLRDCRWFSAQVGHRVWPSMAEFVQLLQSPKSLAFRRCSLAISRTRSLRSSVWFLRRSYSARSWRLASTSDGVGSGQRFGCRAFGAGFSVGLLGVVFRAGFPTRFFLLAGRPPALAGSGREKVNSKVWPTAHLCRDVG